MIIEKNKELDYIITDDFTGMAYDPVNDITFLFNETGLEILELLNEKQSYDCLVKKMCQRYPNDAIIVESQINDFVSKAIDKGVIKILD